MVEGGSDAGGINLVDGMLAPGQTRIAVWWVEKGPWRERGLLERGRLWGSLRLLDRGGAGWTDG